MDRNFLILNAAYLIFALPLAFMDARKFRISLPFLLLGSVVLVCVRFFVLPGQPLPLAKNLFFALATSFLIYFCTRVLTAQGLGMGDVFFGLFSALYTGFYMNIVATVFAALLGVLYYLFLAVVQKIKKNSFVHRPIFAIPFVPFISSGSVLSMLLFWVIA